MNWEDYISNLPNSIPDDLKTQILSMWELLASLDISDPSVAMYLPDTTNSFQMNWDKNEHHLDIDVWADGTYEWFYRNRKTDEVESSMDNDALLIGSISDELVRVMGLFKPSDTPHNRVGLWARIKNCLNTLAM